MLHCANPECKKEVRYFREGRLFLIDAPETPIGDCAAHTARKIVWLCRDCSAKMSVECWRPAGEQLQKRSSQLPSVHPPLLPLTA